MPFELSTPLVGSKERYWPTWARSLVVNTSIVFHCQAILLNLNIGDWATRLHRIPDIFYIKHRKHHVRQMNCHGLVKSKVEHILANFLCLSHFLDRYHKKDNVTSLPFLSWCIHCWGRHIGIYARIHVVVILGNEDMYTHTRSPTSGSSDQLDIRDLLISYWSSW